MNEDVATTADDAVIDDSRVASAKSITTVVYALQGISFIIGLTFIAAVIVNYVKRQDVRGTWLESHFRWQIRTFWFSLLWSAIGLFTVMIVVGYFVLLANLIWVLYRIIRGWLALAEGKELYLS